MATLSKQSNLQSYLGVTVSNDLTGNRHVECIVNKKAAKRVYILYQVKRAGISQLYLVTE